MKRLQLISMVKMATSRLGLKTPSLARTLIRIEKTLSSTRSGNLL